MSDKLAAAMHGFEPVEIAGVVHDNQYCADSAYADAEDWEGWQGFDTGCHDGEVCGPCGAESCYGQCTTDNYGDCPCRCHKEDTEVTDVRSD